MDVWTPIRKKWIDFCLTFPAAYEDYPFHDPNWTVMRHQANHKTFVFIYEREGNLCMNVKCEPLRADFLRKVYSSVIPGWHMNKEHWNTVVLDGSIPAEEIEKMIADSYTLIQPKIKTKNPPQKR